MICYLTIPSGHGPSSKVSWLHLWLAPSLRLKQKACACLLQLMRGWGSCVVELSYCYGIHGACCYESISHHNYLICPFFKLGNKVERLTGPSLIHLRLLPSLAEEGSPSAINQQALG